MPQQMQPTTPPQRKAPPIEKPTISLRQLEGMLAVSANDEELSDANRSFAAKLVVLVRHFRMLVAPGGILSALNGRQDEMEQALVQIMQGAAPGPEAPAAAAPGAAQADPGDPDEIEARLRQQAADEVARIEAQAAAKQSQDPAAPTEESAAPEVPALPPAPIQKALTAPPRMVQGKRGKNGGAA